MESEQDNEHPPFQCGCGIPWKSQRSLDRHQLRCKWLSSQVHNNLRLATTNTTGKNARIVNQVTHTKLREEFRRGNSGKHERTGRYSSNILYQAPTVESRARSVVADRRQKEHEELMISYYAAKSNEKTDPRVADTSLDDDDSEADEAFARMMLNADLHSDDDDSVAGMEGDEEEEEEEV